MKDDINSHIGHKIYLLRTQLGISQEELSFRANLHRAYIGQIERAEKKISIQNLEKLSKGLNVHISELLKFDKQ